MLLTFTSIDDLKRNSFKGAVYAGYGHLLKRWFYLGAEAFADFSQYDMESSGSGGEIENFETTLPRQAFTTAVNVTTKLNPQASAPEFIPEQFTVPLYLSSEENKVGLRLGGGIEQRLTRNLAIRADYIYTDYGSVNVSGSSPTVHIDSVNFGPSTISTSNNTSVKLINNSVLLGLSYYF